MRHFHRRRRRRSAFLFIFDFIFLYFLQLKYIVILLYVGTRIYASRLLRPGIDWIPRHNNNSNNTPVILFHTIVFGVLPRSPRRKIIRRPFWKRFFCCSGRVWILRNNNKKNYYYYYSLRRRRFSDIGSAVDFLRFYIPRHAIGFKRRSCPFWLFRTCTVQ